MRWFSGYKYLLAAWAAAALLVVSMLSGVQWLLQPRYERRTIAQWLRILALEPGRSGSPLDITRVIEDTNECTTFLEVPLSYDLMREHNFLRGVGYIDPVIDGHVRTDLTCLRGTNGSVLIPLSWYSWEMRPGLHQAKVQFELWTGADRRVFASGSARTIGCDNHPTSH